MWRADIIVCLALWSMESLCICSFTMLTSECLGGSLSTKPQSRSEEACKEREKGQEFDYSVCHLAIYIALKAITIC